LSPSKHWLPATLDFDQQSNWIEVIEAAYKVFRKDFFEDTVCHFRSCPICMNEMKERGKEKSFWHLVQKTEIGKPYSRRGIPDLQRAVRLPWVRPIIVNSDEPEITQWDFYEGSGVVRTYLWLKDWDFVVIIEKLEDKYMLITAFHIDFSREKNQLQQKYTKRIT
jgi:hypothetical protein